MTIWLRDIIPEGFREFFVEEIIGIKPVADAEWRDIFPDSPEIKDPNFNTPNPHNNLPTNPHKYPVCWEPPRQIYEIPGLDGILPPELPPRRLPPEGDDQREIKTPIGQVFTIQEWIQWREFGHLLWNPLDADPLIIRQGFSRDFKVELKIALEDGLRKYQKWLAAQNDLEYAKSKEYTQDYNFWDGCAWITPKYLKGCQGDLSVNFGMTALQKLGAVFSSQANNCLYGIVDSIPNGYEIRLAELPNTEQLSNKLKNLEFLGNQSLLELLGIGDFPVQVPKNLTGLPSFEEFKQKGIDDRKLDDEFFKQQGEKNYTIEDLNKQAKELEKKLGEEYAEKYYDKINNLTEFLGWQASQLDALFGAYPIEIELEDSDLSTEENQTQKITLPNVSETLAELMGNSLLQRTYTNALIDMLLRALQEIASTKALSVVTNSAIESIVDYLGFKIEKKQKEVEFFVTPNLETKEDEAFDLSKYLTNSKVRIGVDEFDDSTTLEMYMTELIEMARISKSRNTRSVNLNDLKTLKDLFLNSKDILDGKKDPDDKSKLEEFLEKVENGFTSEPNIQDAENPWGRDRNQRPKIRELGKDGKS